MLSEALQLFPRFCLLDMVSHVLRIRSRRSPSSRSGAAQLTRSQELKQNGSNEPRANANAVKTNAPAGAFGDLLPFCTAPSQHLPEDTLLGGCSRACRRTTDSNREAAREADADPLWEPHKNGPGSKKRPALTTGRSTLT